MLYFGVVDLMLSCSSFYQILVVGPLELSVDQLYLSFDPSDFKSVSVDPLAVDSPILSPPFYNYPLEEKSFHSGLTGVG